MDLGLRECSWLTPPSLAVAEDLCWKTYTTCSGFEIQQYSFGKAGKFVHSLSSDNVPEDFRLLLCLRKRAESWILATSTSLHDLERALFALLRIEQHYRFGVSSKILDIPDQTVAFIKENIIIKPTKGSRCPVSENRTNNVVWELLPYDVHVHVISLLFGETFTGMTQHDVSCIDLCATLKDALQVRREQELLSGRDASAYPISSKCEPPSGANQRACALTRYSEVCSNWVAPSRDQLFWLVVLRDSTHHMTYLENSVLSAIIEPAPRGAKVNLYDLLLFVRMEGKYLQDAAVEELQGETSKDAVVCSVDGMVGELHPAMNNSLDLLSKGTMAGVYLGEFMFRGQSFVGLTMCAAVGFATGVAAGGLRVVESLSNCSSSMVAYTASMVRQAPQELLGPSTLREKNRSTGVHSHTGGVVYGIYKGLSALSDDCIDAVISVGQEPYQGAQAHRSLGALHGVSKAVFTLLTQPISGVLDVFGGALKGVSNDLEFVREIGFDLYFELRFGSLHQHVLHILNSRFGDASSSALPSTVGTSSSLLPAATGLSTS